MKGSHRLALFGLAALLAASLPAAPAAAGSHLWRFNEFYSSRDRTIQFIEMVEIGGSENETAIEDHWFKTDSYNQDESDLLGSPLPFGTAHKKFLVGSVSYAALPGVPAPDYVIPDGVIDPTGDTVRWWFYETLAIPPNTMPTNGVLSLTVEDPSIPTDFLLTLNSPTNFAGETGMVVLPSHVPSVGPRSALALWGLVVAVGLAGLTLGARRRLLVRP